MSGDYEHYTAPARHTYVSPRAVAARGELYGIRQTPITVRCKFCGLVCRNASPTRAQTEAAKHFKSYAHKRMVRVRMREAAA